MAYVDPVTGQRTRGADVSSYGRIWPTTRDERHRAWRSRWSAYRQTPYADGEVERLALFVARDTDDNITAVSQRLMTDYSFVCRVHAAAIATGGVALQTIPGSEAALPAGQDVWDRSKIAAKLPTWAINQCVDGIGYIEVQRAPDGPVLVWHQPQHVDVVWDPTHREIERAYVSFVLPADVTVEDGQLSTGGSGVRYLRVLTRDDVTVYRDGVRSEAESGPHALERVPLVAVPYRMSGDGEFPDNAAGALDDALALVNSTLTQIQTVGSRQANPILAVIGARLADGADLQRQGKAISLPADADIRWVEAALQGLRSLVETIGAVLPAIRATYPAFMFMESGANASGTALSYRASAFVDEIRPPRQAMYDALAEAVSIAVVMPSNRAWVPEDDVYEVDGGPVLSMDLKAMIDARLPLLQEGLMLRGDLVRYLQGAQVLPEGDADAYAARALAERDAAMQQISEAVRMLQALEGATSTQDVVSAVEVRDAQGEQPPPDRSTQVDQKQPTTTVDDAQDMG